MQYNTASLKNLVVGNVGSTRLCTPSWRLYNFDLHSSFLIIASLLLLHYSSQALMFEVEHSSALLGNVVGYVNHPFNVSVIHIASLYCTQLYFIPQWVWYSCACGFNVCYYYLIYIYIYIWVCNV